MRQLPDQELSQVGTHPGIVTDHSAQELRTNEPETDPRQHIIEYSPPASDCDERASGACRPAAAM